ncbi:MAG: hypothetical protein U5L06_14920 [Rhodovibrio sp.]|nr:hypothetical protein [Rhodovibrio sp.]
MMRWDLPSIIGFKDVRGTINDGLWVVDDMEPNRKILELHRMSFVSALPLSWFIMQHFIGPACIGDIRRETPDISEHYPDDAKLMEAIVRGDPSSLRDVAEKISQDIGDKREAPETLRFFLPTKLKSMLALDMNCPAILDRSNLIAGKGTLSPILPDTPNTWLVQVANPDNRVR